MSEYKYFIEAEWLAARLSNENLFVLDCRFDLFDPVNYGRAAYEKGMIQGAYYFDIDEDWTEDKGAHGGRRGTPDPNVLGTKLASVGIRMDSVIVCYDDGVYSAPRAWWQLRYMGYKNVYVLNGGFKRWCELGLPVSDRLPLPREGGFWEGDVDDSMFADKDQVKAAIGKQGCLIVDSRAYQRYSGEYEPLYSKKGHIPSAIDIHYLTNMKNGESAHLIGVPNQWRENLASCLEAEEVFLYCGSAIEACINYMFLAELGKPARLYVGSMSDWVGYDDVEVESTFA